MDDDNDEKGVENKYEYYLNSQLLKQRLLF